MQPDPTTNDLSWSAVSATDGSSTTPSSAIISTPSKDVGLPHVHTHHTSVPCADPLSTGPNGAQHDPRTVSTLLLPDNWESKIRTLRLWEKYSNVPHGLHIGFHIGTAHPVSVTYTPPNHSSATSQPDVILKHINTKIAAGQYTSPFTCEALELLIGPFQKAPLGIIEKASAPGPYHIIQDFSYSPNPDSPLSLNAQIDAGEFPCIWGTFEKVADTRAHISIFAQATTLDVHSAYWQIPVRPKDQNHIVFMWGDDFSVDGCVPGMSGGNSCEFRFLHSGI